MWEPSMSWPTVLWVIQCVCYYSVSILMLQIGSLSLSAVKVYCQDHLAKYKLPQRVWIVSELPRNAMGKVNKKQLVKQFLEHNI